MTQWMLYTVPADWDSLEWADTVGLLNINHSTLTTYHSSPQHHTPHTRQHITTHTHIYIIYHIIYTPNLNPRTHDHTHIIHNIWLYTVLPLYTSYIHYNNITRLMTRYTQTRLTQDTHTMVNLTSSLPQYTSHISGTSILLLHYL